MKNAIDFSYTLAAARNNLSVEQLEERLRLFERNSTLDVYHTFLDYNPGSDECDSVKGCTAHIFCLDT